MSLPIPGIAVAPTRFGLIPRVIVVTAVLAVEILIGSYLVQATPTDALQGAPETVRHIQHWLFRFIIAYAVSLSILAYLRSGAFAAATLGTADHAPVRLRFGLLHALLLVPFLSISAVLYSPSVPFVPLVVAWHLLAVAAAIALFAALAPAPVWIGALRATRGLPLFAILPAVAAVAAIKLSQMLWAPAAALTFRLVKGMLQPLLPSLQSDPVSLTLIGGHFAVQIAEVCSGLEGVGLMLAFCTAWLWFFRREYFFPRALLVVPLGVIAVFALNAVRIAALVLIGEAGYVRVATVGFHSQAGWIAFNLAAFGVAILAHTNPWVSRVAAARKSHARAAAAPANPTAAYLMPLLAMLAAGMIAHAFSAGFEILYPLRLAAALAALWIYRRSYANEDFRCSWRGPLVGAAVFGLWAATAAYTGAASEPSALTALPPGLRGAWIGCRLIAAAVAIPIVDELAFRGYLLRRLSTTHFESAPFSATRWPALAVSALTFGIMHGRFWIPSTIAGLAYGSLVMRTNKLGESIAAHAMAGALTAAYVLLFRQWQLW